MKPFNNNEFYELFSNYQVSGPSTELVVRTKSLMREELLQQTAKSAVPEKVVFMLAGLAVVLSLCLFYMFTVWTIIRFFLPSFFLGFPRHMVYAFTAASGSLFVCVLMVLFFKQFQVQRPVKELGNLLLPTQHQIIQ